MRDTEKQPEYTKAYYLLTLMPEDVKALYQIFTTQCKNGEFLLDGVPIKKMTDIELHREEKATTLQARGYQYIQRAGRQDWQKIELQITQRRGTLSVSPEEKKHLQDTAGLIDQRLHSCSNRRKQIVQFIIALILLPGQAMVFHNLAVHHPSNPLIYLILSLVSSILIALFFFGGYIFHIRKQNTIYLVPMDTATHFVDDYLVGVLEIGLTLLIVVIACIATLFI